MDELVKNTEKLTIETVGNGYIVTHDSIDCDGHLERVREVYRAREERMNNQGHDAHMMRDLLSFVYYQLTMGQVSGWDKEVVSISLEEGDEL